MRQPDPGPHRTTAVPDLTYRLVIRACHVLFRVLGLRIGVVGAERLPRTGPVVVAANHSSFLDFMVVGLVATLRGRLVRFMAKQSVFDAPVSGQLMRGMHHIPVDRAHGETAARTAYRALRAGEVVGIYPEATIGRAFVVKDRADLKRGAAFLALRTGAPILPVAHWGVHRVLTVGGRFSLRRGTAVSVLVGEPLVPLPGEDADGLTDRLHTVLAAMVDQLLDDYPQLPAEPRRAWWWPAARGGAAPETQEARLLDEEARLRADAGRRGR
ncbi:lysophospholipid acyltransferase family protein [Pedococcus ginsenosidimutans]|uniref:Lysophospholipid acyltransferase family protein n=1 Tax=Pedococcus ginsenosidimutans TaxID=490570 RepID=A0ABP8XQC1_9MICO